MPDTVAGICWPHGGTVGCITVTTKVISGHFPATQGDDAIVCCCLVPAGKYRNGAARVWCRAHQQYWGVKADLAALEASGVQRCAGHAAAMGYVRDPLVLDLRRHARVSLARVAGGIEVNTPTLRATVPALALACDPAAPLFGCGAIVQVNVTPPALDALRAARQGGMETGCVECARCGHPHTDKRQFIFLWR